MGGVDWRPATLAKAYKGKAKQQEASDLMRSHTGEPGELAVIRSLILLPVLGTSDAVFVISSVRGPRSHCTAANM